MIYVAMVFIAAASLFALMRIGLSGRQLTLQQFFILYLLALIGLVLVGLGVTGRLHWLFALVGSILPFAGGLVRWSLRIWRSAGLLTSIRNLISQLTGLNKETADQTSASANLTRHQALDILGLEGNPSSDEIKVAHRQLIQKLHPDRGGSTILAAQINEAKVVLLRDV